MRTRHGAAAIALRVIGGFVAFVALVIGATMLILGTPWGGERLRRQVVKRVNAQIQGRLDVARLSFGGDRVDLWGVTLRDPDGGVVADIAHVDVGFSVARLVRKQVRIVAVEIQTPRLTLISDARGSNLARATAPRHETPPRPEKPRVKSDKEGWVIDLGRFELTNGDVSVRVSPADAAASPGSGPSRATTATNVHIAALSSFITARYATGNGSLDATFRLNGESKTVPVGPLDLSADVRVRGDLYRGRLEGILLGGTMRARGDVDRAHLENADALVAVAIPGMNLGGHEWGPLRIDGDAHPGATPTLSVALAIPGVKLSGKSNDSGSADAGAGAAASAGNIFLFDGQLALTDLAVTARALQALGVAALPALAGNGHVDFGFGGPMSDAPARWSAHAKAAVAHVRVAENVIDGVELDARTARLSRTPGQAELHVAVASVQAGATALRGITLAASVRERTFSTELALVSPDPINLKGSGNLDDDGRGLALEHLVLSYPGGEWTTEGIARVASAEDRLSLANLRLRSAGQTIDLDGAKTNDQLDAHLAVHDLRLSQLPAFLVDPKLRLAGVVDADVTAAGTTDNPRVAARVQVQGAAVDLQHGRAPRSPRSPPTCGRRWPTIASTERSTSMRPSRR